MPTSLLRIKCYHPTSVILAPTRQPGCLKPSPSVSSSLQRPVTTKLFLDAIGCLSRTSLTVLINEVDSGFSHRTASMRRVGLENSQWIKFEWIQHKMDVNSM